MLGISKGSSKALCFVIDTTKSMSDDIEAVRAVTSSIIDNEVGTENEPSAYILVPFNDPGTISRVVYVTLVSHFIIKVFTFCCRQLNPRFWTDDKDYGPKGLQECHQFTIGSRWRG